MELGFLTTSGHLVTIDTIGWRTLFPAFHFDVRSGSLRHLTRTTTLERRSEVTMSVRLHRRGWTRRGETVLRRTRATWYRGNGLDLFLGPNARSIRVPWRGELTKVHRPFFALERPIKDALVGAVAHRGAPSLVWLDRTSVRGCTRFGRTVTVYAIERKEFSDFVLGKVRAEIDFPSEADAIAFAEGLPIVDEIEALDGAVAADITRSKSIVWTPKVLALVVGGLAFFGLVIAGTTVGALEGKLQAAAQATVEIAAGVALVSWALPLLLRTRRKEFLDLLEKWPRLLCERWGKDYQTQAARAEEVLRSMGVLPRHGLPDLMSVDAYLRSLPPDAFYGTLALQVGLFAIDRMVRTVGRDVDAWWEYLPDRRECAFRVEAAGLRVYPLTAVMTVWQMRDLEGLDPFVRSYGRELQMRLAFADRLPVFVALGFTAPGWEAFSKFAARVDGELAGRARSRILRIEEEQFRERTLDYGAVQIVFVEKELGEEETRFVPFAAFPFVVRSASAVVNVPSVEEIARGIPDLPPDRVLAWVAASAAVPSGEAEISGTLEVCGVVESAGFGAEAREGDAPTASIVVDEPLEETEGVPLASVRARVLEVREGTNEFSRTPLWCLLLDFSGVHIPVAARRDAWPNPPAVGDFLAGNVWFLARPA